MLINLCGGAADLSHMQKGPCPLGLGEIDGLQGAVAHSGKPTEY